ncbi:mannose-6-phosphate isomerase, class I [Parasalinivibrio latis]|uniref:mannose-6-phosphate isomerase, class I n=1 Tax=Parasalinivibrio latis TaxID=2952610 RepID=UPI0030DFA81D
MTMSSAPLFLPMNNVIQDYAWGSFNALDTLFGIPNTEGKPQAEIWMGAHPNGCSTVQFGKEEILLSDFINASPDTILGARTLSEFGELPYLFKVLSAEKALSVQVHPSKSQAEQGFTRENEAGIALNAANRNYKDPNHKPELVFALTPYQAMNGFREISDIVTLFDALDLDIIGDIVEALKATPTPEGLKAFFGALLSLEGETKDLAVSRLLAYATVNQQDPLFALLMDLSEQYPGDIGLFAPLMLHVVTLQPGEAMFLDACTPHAYIKGTGLEIMANSDNVLRAGLTPKYMDVPELVANTLFEAKPANKVLLAPNEDGNAKHFAIPVPDFKFSVYEGNSDIDAESAEILFSLDGDITLIGNNGETLTVAIGQSAFVPATTGKYRVEATGRFARAYC